MALYSYAYTVPGDAPDALVVKFINFETTFTEPVLWAPLRVPAGTTLSRAADGYETMDGWQDIVIEQVGEPYGYTKFADLLTYATAVHGGLNDGEDAEICVRADQPDGTYAYYNVIAHVPRLGADYTHIDSIYVQNLKLRYTVLNEYTPT